MKGNLLAVLFCCMLLMASCAAGDGYENGDRWDQPFSGTGGIATAEVISKSVTLRDAPSMSAGSIVSIPSEASLMVLEAVDDSWVRVQWQKSGSQTYKGYVRSEYIVINPEYITLRKSNTPAYSMPARSSKLLGSLSKMTRLRVIGTWDNYYCVFLRGGSAFIPMGSDIWTETELNDLKESTYQSSRGGHQGRTAQNTSLRTGPGKDWPEIMELKSGAKLDVSANEEDGWVFVKNMEGNCGYVRASDIE